MLERRTPLVQKTPLTTKTPLKSGGSLRKVGARKKREIAASKDVRSFYLANHSHCEIGPLIQHKIEAYKNCTVIAQCIHERKKRSQGGSLVDTENLMASCFFCNGWVEDWPTLARELGLVVHAHEDPADIHLNRS